MQVALLSDVHGNSFALDVVLADLKKTPVDQVICLGDMIQGGPQPAQTVARLREMACPIVMGNSDAWLLTGQDTDPRETLSERQTRTREWSLAQLNDVDRSFIAEFSPTVEVQLSPTQKMIGFHGSPTSFDAIILPHTPQDEIQQMLANEGYTMFAGGHTHMPQIRRMGPRLYVNPGSVGFAYAHFQEETQFKADAWAEYCVVTLNNAQLHVEFRRVPYDAATYIDIILHSGMPDATAIAERYR